MRAPIWTPAGAVYLLKSEPTDHVSRRRSALCGILTELDSPDWLVLQHAYGPAADIPSLLRQLDADPTPRLYPKDEPWFSLWSALCHQGDVYTASYAAVPHIVGIALKTKGMIDIGFFLLPACIEVARSIGRGPLLAPSLTRSYRDALRQLHDCAFVHAADEWSSDMAQSVAGALAASKGHIALAQALLNLDQDIIARINAGDW